MKIKYILTIKDFGKPERYRTVFNMSVDSYSELENLLLVGQDAMINYGHQAEDYYLGEKRCEICNCQLGPYEKHGSICIQCKKKLKEDELRIFSAYK